jgi:hypothetical protein
MEQLYGEFAVDRGEPHERRRITESIIVSKINAQYPSTPFKGYVEFANEISKMVEVDPNIPEKGQKTDNLRKHQ